MLLSVTHSTCFTFHLASLQKQIRREYQELFPPLSSNAQMQATTDFFHFMYTTDVAYWQERSFRGGQAIVIQVLVEDLYTKRGFFNIIFHLLFHFSKYWITFKILYMSLHLQSAKTICLNRILVSAFLLGKKNFQFLNPLGSDSLYGNDINLQQYTIL